MTLKAVATEVGVTHANLLHHFGSAGGLQTDLMTMMMQDMNNTLREGIVKFRAGEVALDELISLVFEVFSSGGAGDLAAWLATTGETDKLQTLAEVVKHFASDVSLPDPSISIPRALMFVTLMAFADALIGKHLAPMLELPPETARQITVQFTPFAMRSPG